jgi:hypothetical protein
MPYLSLTAVSRHSSPPRSVIGCPPDAINTTQDILDPDVFWTEELLLATKDRLFGCGFDTLDSTRSGNPDLTVNGLIGGHAYSGITLTFLK